jgi:hypothetical protein
MRHFFITDREEKHCSLSKRCPTDEYETGETFFHQATLKSSLFRRFRDLIMGVMAQPKPGLGKVQEEKPTSDRLGKPGQARLDGLLGPLEVLGWSVPVPTPN